jgi:uncharacterized protein (DUF1015 family)
MPHERTMPGPIEDRMRVLRTVRANLSPVYALWRGPTPELAAVLEEAATGRAPDAAVADEEGVEHRLWVLPAGGDGDTPAPWDRIALDLNEERLLIADGHHRYSVALAFRERMRAEVGPGPWDRMPMLLVDAAVEDPPVLPIHRVVLDGAAVRTEGRRVRDLSEVLAALDDDTLVYGSAAREGRGLVHRVDTLEGAPPTVCALHERVLGDAGLRFVTDAAAAEEAVRLGDSSAAFFLPPTRVRRIPQKSTYFWPKPRTGMVIRALD